MYPNSPNIRCELLTMGLVQNSIGTKAYQLTTKKEVIGINKSITSQEYYESKRSDIIIDLLIKVQSFLYDGSTYVSINADIYKIERTYQIGQFIELYLSKTNIRKSDVIGFT